MPRIRLGDSHFKPRRIIPPHSTPPAISPAGRRGSIRSHYASGTPHILVLLPRKRPAKTSPSRVKKFHLFGVFREKHPPPKNTGEICGVSFHWKSIPWQTEANFKQIYIRSFRNIYRLFFLIRKLRVVTPLLVTKHSVER